MKIVEFTQASFYNEYEVSISLIKIKPCSSSFGLMVTEKHHNQRNEGASGRVDCISISINVPLVWKVNTIVR